MILRSEGRHEHMDLFPRQTAAERFPAEFRVIGQNDAHRGLLMHQRDQIGTFIADVQKPLRYILLQNEFGCSPGRNPSMCATRS